MWYRSESGVKPQEMQEGKSVVYIRKNITEEQREVDGETATVWAYDECKVPKEIYPIIAQQQADIDYLSMLVEE